MPSSRERESDVGGATGRAADCSGGCDGISACDYFWFAISGENWDYIYQGTRVVFKVEELVIRREKRGEMRKERFILSGGVVLAGMIFFGAGVAYAEEPEKWDGSKGTDISFFSVGIFAQKENSSKIFGEKYANGPNLGNSEKIGKETLLGGLVVEENDYSLPRYLKNVKNKNKHAGALKKKYY